MMLMMKHPACLIRFVLSAAAFIGCLGVMQGAQAQQVVIGPPLAEMTVTSNFGWRNIDNGSTFHKGVDLRARTPTPALVTPGYISTNYAVNRGAAGNRLIVRYSCNVEVWYFHLSSYSEPPPMPVTGSSGTATPHLHFEIRVDSVPVDPMAAFGANLCDEATKTCLKDHAAFAMTPPAAPGQPENRGTRQDECRNNPATNFPGSPPLVAPSGMPTEEHEDSGLPVPVGTGPQRPPLGPQHYPPPTFINGVESRADNPPPGGQVIYELLPNGMTTGACDVDVFTLLRAKGAFEAQEDVIYSEMAIHKPDSVLEYSCFNQFMNHTATPGAAIFSETDAFSGPMGGLLGAILGVTGRPVPYRLGRINIPMFLNTRLAPASMDIALGGTVMTTMGYYLNFQFPHNLGGGTTEVTNSIEGLIGNQGYNCDIMQTIWTASKCQNFSDTTYMDTEKGPFFQFEEMIAETGDPNDPRTQRGECIDTGMYEQDIMRLQNVNFGNGLEPAYFNTAASTPEDFGSILGSMFGGLFGGLFGDDEGGGPDLESGVTLSDMTDPEQCDVLPPISTGLSVMFVENPGEATENVVQFEEHFCSNPGCHYDYEADECTR